MNAETRPVGRAPKSTPPDRRQGTTGVRQTAEPLTLDQALEESLEEGRRRRDAGMEFATHSTLISWKRVAEKRLAELAATGREFTAEDLRERVGHPLGSHDNSMGPLFGAAARRGEIVHVGYQQATRPEAHARILRVWRGAGGGR